MPPPSPPRLQARGRQLDQLRRVATRVRHHGPHLVAVRGESGIGKTRLIDELLDGLTAEQPGLPRFRVARAVAAGSTERNRPVLHALSYLLAAETQRGAWRGKTLVRTFREHAPDVAETIIDLATLPFIPPVAGALLKLGVRIVSRTQGRPGAQPALPANPTTVQLFDTFRSCARQEPLVLLVDDAEFADPDTVQLIDLIVRELQHDAVPLLVVVAYAPRSPASPVEETARSLWHSGLATVVDLPPLPPLDVAPMVAEQLGDVPLGDALAWVHEETEGIPALVLELAARLEECGLGNPATWTPERLAAALPRLGDLPRREGIVAARLDGLSAGEQDLLATAAVLGRVFQRDGLLRAHAAPETTETAALLDALLGRRALLEPDVADGSYRFAHARMREHVLSLLRGDPHAYRRRHRACARWLETLPGDPDRFAALAAHYREAGQLDDAVAVVERAAEAARSRGEWRGRVAELARRVQGWTAEAPLPTRVRAANATAEILMVGLRFGEAFEATESARRAAEGRLRARPAAGAVADDLAGHAAATGVLRAVIAWEHNPDTGDLRLIDHAVGLYEQLGSDWRPRLLFALHARAWLAKDAGDHAACEDALDRAARVLEAFRRSPQAAHSEPRRWEAQLAQVRGESLSARGRWDDATRMLSRALDVSAAIGDHLGEAAALGERGIARLAAGDPGGERDVMRAMGIERYQLGSPEGVAKWLHQLGVLHHRRGELEQAAGALWLAEAIWADLDHTARTSTQELLEAIGAAVDRARGDDAYGRLRAEFDPWASPYWEYAFLWRLPPFGKHRGPILRRGDAPWESLGVCNPAVLVVGDEIVMLYRGIGPGADGERVSSIGRATATEPTAFQRDAEPVLFGVAPHGLLGVEDPRLAVLSVDEGGAAGEHPRTWAPRSRSLADRVVGTANVYDGVVARIVLFHVQDGELRRLVATPPVLGDDQWFPGLAEPKMPRGWAKSAVIIPRPVNDRWWMLFGDYDLYAAWSYDMVEWRIVPRPVLPRRPGTFFSALVEPGPTPAFTEAGIHLVFNGAAPIGDGRLRYAVGEALLSLTDPTQVLRCSTTPIVTVDHDEERHGLVRHEVAFATAWCRWRGSHLLYFGMGDHCIGLATADATYGPR